MVNIEAFEQVEYPESSISQGDRRRARDFFRWYTEAVIEYGSRLIVNGFGLEPDHKNLREICLCIHDLLVITSYKERLPENLLQIRRDQLLGTKWEFLYEEEELSTYSLEMAMSASLVLSWACLTEEPRLPWRFCTLKRATSYHRPVLTFDPKWDEIDPFELCFVHCHSILRGEVDPQFFWRIVSEGTHEVFETAESKLSSE